MAEFANDTFTEASNTALTAHTPDTGSGWSKNTTWGSTDTTVIASTDTARTATDGQWSMHTFDDAPGTADHKAKADVVVGLTTETYQAGVCCRHETGAKTGYIAWIRPSVANEVQLYRYDAGTANLLAEYSIPSFAAQTYNLELDVTDESGDVRLKVNLDASEVISYLDNSANKITATNRVGIISRAASGHVDLDNFSATDNANQITPTGIGTAEAFGTASLNATQTISASAIATAEAHGSHSVTKPGVEFANDTFTEATNTALTAHTPDTGSGWSKNTTWGSTDTTVIASTDTARTATDGQWSMHTFDDAPGTADHKAKADVVVGLTTETYQAGVCCRHETGAKTGYIAWIRPNEANEVQLYRYDAGTANLLADYSIPSFAAQTYNLELDVTDESGDVRLKVNLDSSEVISYLDNSANKITATNRVGIISRAAAGHVDLDNFSASSAASGTITADELLNIPYQRSGGATTARTITGTYSGTPTAIEARIMDGVTQVVAWTTLDASPSGGTFSGSINVPDGGWYHAEVRFSNDTGITDAQTTTWAIGARVPITGQSNGDNWFTDGTTPTADPDLRRYDGSWGTPQAGEEGATAFGNKLVAELGVPVGVINAAEGGTALRQEADSGSGYWVTNADAKGNQYTGDFTTVMDAVGWDAEYVVWVQGERDARSDVVTESEYNTSLAALFAFFRTDFSDASLPIVISYLGRGTAAGDDDDDFENIRNAERSLNDSQAHTYGTDCYDLALADSIHYSDYTKHGERMAQACADIAGTETYHQGPSATWTSVSATQTDVNLTHNGGTDFTPTTGITGIEVLDDGTPVTVSAAVRQDANTIRLTHTSITGTRSVRSGYGANPTISSVVVDNSAAALPIQSGTIQEKLSISVSSVPSAEAIGNASLDNGQEIQPTGKASDEAHGSATLQPGAVNLSPGAMATAEAIGGHQVTLSAQALQIAGIGSAEIIPTHSIGLGAVNIAPLMLSSAEAFGLVSLSVGATYLVGQSILSGEQVGGAVIQPGAVNLGVTSMATAEAIGAQSVLPGAVSVVPSGLASTETVSSIQLDLSVTLTLPAITPTEAFGDISFMLGQVVISTTGIDEGQIGELLVLAGAVGINPGAIPPLITFGGHEVSDHFNKSLKYSSLTIQPELEGETGIGYGNILSSE